MLTTKNTSEVSGQTCTDPFEGTLLGSRADQSIAAQVAALHGGFSDAEFAELAAHYDKLRNNPDRIE